MRNSGTELSPTQVIFIVAGFVPKAGEEFYFSGIVFW